MRISQLTRRDIVDALTVEKFNWAGHLEETESTWAACARPTAVSKTRRATSGSTASTTTTGTPCWCSTMPAFGLMNGDDDAYLAFLCETLHAVIRSDPTEVERFKRLINGYLAHDGYQRLKNHSVRKAGVRWPVCRRKRDAGIEGGQRSHRRHGSRLSHAADYAHGGRHQRGSGSRYRDRQGASPPSLSRDFLLIQVP